MAEEVVAFWVEPKPAEVVVANEAMRLVAAMRQLLSSSRNTPTRSTVVPFRRDVFSYLFPFTQFSSHLLTCVPLSDFNPHYFPPGWHTWKNNKGDGYYAQEIYLKPRLKKTKPLYAPNPNDPTTIIEIPGTVYYTEVVSFKIRPKNC